MELKDNHLYLVAFKFIGLALIAFLFCSCISFDIADSPSKYAWPNNSPTANLCGPVGAFFAYYITYYLGEGAYVIMLSIVAALCFTLANREISQPILRTIGMLLITIAVSATMYLMAKVTINSFPHGRGGVLGIASTTFFKTHLSNLGTVIVIISAWIVGAVLLADSIVVGALRICGAGAVKVLGLFSPALSSARAQSEKLSEIWQRLSAKKIAQAQTISNGTGKNEPSLAEMMAAEAAIIETDQDECEYDKEKYEVDEESDNQMEDHLEDTPAPAVNLVEAEPEFAPYLPATFENYLLPELDLLIEPEKNSTSMQSKIINAKSAALEQVLREFRIEASVVGSEPGPTITMFELALSPGIKVSQINNLCNDIARALGAPIVRVVAPLPGRHTIGIEVPNTQKETVRLKDLIETAGKKPNKMHIPLFLGKDSSGESLVSDLAAMPHMLIAGTTGSGKSVCINTIIMSIMMLKRPDEVKLILVDPKMVEMTAFAKIPHLMSPIITEVSKAEQIFEWATTKMDERYALLAEAGVKNIAGYNALGSEEIIRRFNPHSPEEEAKIPKRMPYFVIIVDELADLMMTSSKEIEANIVRLAQKSRAVGIHIILATQRPQATVVTGLIKSNMPARASFRVASRMDSRIVLDSNGAETLLGQGDMLFLKPGTSELIRAQGAFVDDSEIHNVVKHLTEQAEPQFHPELVQLNRVDVGESCKDELFDKAVRIVLETKRGSVSLLQRKLSIGYARSSRIIEAMAIAGILGEYKGSQAREVMITINDWEKLQAQQASDTRAEFSDMTQNQPATTTEPETSEEEYDFVKSDKKADPPQAEVEDDDDTEDEEYGQAATYCDDDEVPDDNEEYEDDDEYKYEDEQEDEEIVEENDKKSGSEYDYV